MPRRWRHALPVHQTVILTPARLCRTIYPVLKWWAVASGLQVVLTGQGICFLHVKCFTLQTHSLYVNLLTIKDTRLSFFEVMWRLCTLHLYTHARTHTHKIIIILFKTICIVLPYRNTNKNKCKIKLLFLNIRPIYFFPPYILNTVKSIKNHHRDNATISRERSNYLFSSYVLKEKRKLWDTS